LRIVDRSTLERSMLDRSIPMSSLPEQADGMFFCLLQHRPIGAAGNRNDAVGTLHPVDALKHMKIGIVGTGTVGCACAMATVNRGSARQIVLVNRTRKTAEAVATDLRYGTPLAPKVEIVDGDYDALAGAGVVMITSGVNEKTGGATDRSDPQGRLRLLDKNAAIYRGDHPHLYRFTSGRLYAIEALPPSRAASPPGKKSARS
jgi:hypothetical protein